MTALDTMQRAWVTASSTHVVSMVNPITAACERGFVPDRLYFLDSPGASQQIQDALDVATTVITEYGGGEPEIRLTSLDEDDEYERIHAHFRDAINEVHDEEGRAAVDITPGRKYMSAIAFTTGMQYDADHVYYMYLEDVDDYGPSYAQEPRTASTLVDFTEVL